MVCGGGCADTVAAGYLRAKVRESSCDYAQRDQRISVQAGEVLPGRQLPGVLDMVARCFEQQALALEKHGGQVLTDSAVHHCWCFPPPPLCANGPLRDASRNKRCNCGAVSLSCIPADASWTALGPDSMLFPVLPHPLPPLPSVGVSREPLQRFPDVSDLLVCRVSALACAGELSRVLLTTAWILAPHQT